MPAHLKADHHGGQQQHHGQQHQQGMGYQGANTYPQMSYQQQQQSGYPGHQQQQHHGGQQQDQNAEIEAQVKKYLPKVLRMCQRQCCTVM